MERQEIKGNGAQGREGDGKEAERKIKEMTEKRTGEGEDATVTEK